jgi:hypothetical protein
VKGVKYTIVGEDFVVLFYVVGCTMILGLVVRSVGGAGAPEKSELVLGLGAL